MLTDASLSAQVVLGRWEKVEALKAGTEIIVKLKAGDRVEGTFIGIGNEDIRLSEVGRAEVRLPKSAVQSIETKAKIRDNLKRGTYIGMAGGAVFGSLAGIHAPSQARIPFVFLGAGLGALCGASVDASIKGHELLYKTR